jgi:hypothetical protein
MEVNEEFLQEIEKDMQSNNGSWVANEKVIKLINEIRKLKSYTKPCCKLKRCNDKT